MAFAIRNRHGRWEIRESRATEAGPRSRTLATFETLTADVVERVRSRSSKPLLAKEVVKAALRAGAPVAMNSSDKAARALIGELQAGRLPRRGLRNLLAEALGSDVSSPSDNARAAATWITATPEQRGETLRDLLLLVDRLPPPKTDRSLRFPPLQSSSA